MNGKIRECYDCMSDYRKGLFSVAGMRVSCVLGRGLSYW